MTTEYVEGGPPNRHWYGPQVKNQRPCGYYITSDKHGSLFSYGPFTTQEEADKASAEYSKGQFVCNYTNVITNSTSCF